MAGGIPEAERDGLAVDHNAGGVVIKARIGQKDSLFAVKAVLDSIHCGDVFAWEGIGRVRNEKTCLAGVSSQLR